MSNDQFTLLLVVLFIGFSITACGLAVVACLLVWRGCTKMYTEFFKNEAMKGRGK